MEQRWVAEQVLKLKQIKKKWKGTEKGLIQAEEPQTV